jgi:hypothetical protein
MLQRDDWGLILRELKSQRNQLLIQAEMNLVCMKRAEEILKTFPKKKDEKPKSKSEKQIF